MGKKKRRAPRRKTGPFGTKYMSDRLRHINTQTLDSSAATEVAEKFENPAFGRGGAHSGMLVESIMFMPVPTDAPNFGGPTPSGWFCHQVQLGDQTGTPVHKAISDEALFAHVHFVSHITTTGANFGPIFPMEVPIVNVVPVVIEQYVSIVLGALTNATYNSKTIYTIIDYYVVEVPDHVYTQIALSRRDQS